MGGSGVNASQELKRTSPGLQALEARPSAESNPAVAKALADYAAGKISLEDAMASGNQGMVTGEQQAYDKQVADIRNQFQAELNKQPEGLRGPLQQAMEAEIAKLPKPSGSNSALMSQLLTTNPLAAQRYLTDSVTQGADTARLFGKGGALDESMAATGQYEKERGAAGDYAKGLQTEEEQLRSRGYSLNPEDFEAYGQMSDELARAFGNQEKGLSASLARQGLAAAPSGQAARLFSGLQGNKAEQLAAAQRKVANDRMAATENRLAGLRGYIGQQQNYGLGLGNLAAGARQATTNLGNLQEVAKSNLFNRNLAGRQQSGAEADRAAGQAAAQQQALQNQANINFAQQQATQGPSFGDVLGGLATGALGTVTGGVAGGIGSSLGRKASKLFG